MFFAEAILELTSLSVSSPASLGMPLSRPERRQTGSLIYPRGAVATVAKAALGAIRLATDKAALGEASVVESYAKICVYLDEIVQEVRPLRPLLTNYIYIFSRCTRLLPASAALRARQAATSPRLRTSACAPLRPRA